MASDGTNDGEAKVADEHVASVPDGCGCTEIWEHLSEQRAAED